MNFCQKNFVSNFVKKKKIDKKTYLKKGPGKSTHWVTAGHKSTYFK